MKRIKFFLEFYRANTFAVLFLFLLTTISLFNMCEVIGGYTYETYTANLFSQMGLNKGVYYMPSTSGAVTGDEIFNDLKAQQFPAVKRIIAPLSSYTAYGKYAININIVEPDNTDVYKFADEGEWFDKNNGINSDGSLNVVAGGYMFQDVNVGDIVELDVYGFDNQYQGSKKAHVIGKDTEPSFAFQLELSAPVVTTGDLFGGGTHNGVFMTPAGVKALYDINSLDGYTQRSINSLISFRDDATEEEIKKVTDYMQDKGTYLTFDEIQESSQMVLEANLKDRLPMPLFTMVISTFASIAISTLLTSKQLSNYKKYYLCGCSRCSSFIYILLAISLIAGLAGALNILYIKLIPRFFFVLSSSVTDYKYNTLIMGFEAITWIVLYTATTILISVMIPFLMIRNNSAVELYRRQA